ncbi:GntR family transcriptional regulator [Mesorhizobium sp.]|uniref:GntR family transcriptional regulator n=1 Tax=Mesorhizobium sp. TaxID=1871066 RepID=UPI0025C0C4AA|nr:GntR family transcriptional regulator [Mesorhizobium sp.]
MKTSITADSVSGAHSTEEGAPRTLTEIIYRKLRSDIVWGVLPPGSPLRSDNLRAAYGIGVSPLREALSRLAAERLVTSVGQRGFRVATISEADVIDVMETRLIIECAALARSIRDGDLQWETRLVAAFHSLSRIPIPHMPGSEAETWVKHHRAFHMSLLSACGSTWQMNLAALFFDQAERFRIVRATKVPTQKLTRDTTREHKQIVDAALERNVDQALAALEDHYRSTTRQVLAAIEDIGEAAGE